MQGLLDASGTIPAPVFCDGYPEQWPLQNGVRAVRLGSKLATVAAAAHAVQVCSRRVQADDETVHSWSSTSRLARQVNRGGANDYRDDDQRRKQQ